MRVSVARAHFQVCTRCPRLPGKTARHVHHAHYEAFLVYTGFASRTRQNEADVHHVHQNPTFFSKQIHSVEIFFFLSRVRVEN